MRIIGVDAGNYENKIVTIDQYRKFVSCLGEYRERKLNDGLRVDDIEYEYKGERGFAGTLARDESEWLSNRLGDSKAHKDGLIRMLLSIYQVCENGEDVKVVTGNPINKHTPVEVAKIEEMLSGCHTITVNGISKSFCVKAIKVAPESASAIATCPTKGRVHIVDVGAGTVGLATVNDMRFIDKDSLSIDMGADSTKEQNIDWMANKILNTIYHKWDRHDRVFVIGGMAEKIEPLIKSTYPKTNLLRLIHNMECLPVTYANALGFYKLGVSLWQN